MLTTLLTPVLDKRNDYNASSAPTVNFDVDAGWSVGSVIIFNDSIYQCTDNTSGAAKWPQLAGSSYLGAWAASTNTPTLADGTGNNGDMYIASDAGTVDFGSGAIAFTAGDQVVYNGTIWQKIEGGVSYVPEDEANKATDFTTVNDTLYPSVEAVQEQLDLKLTESAAAVGSFIDGLTDKSAPVVTDSFILKDSADSNNAKEITFASFLGAGSTVWQDLPFLQTGIMTGTETLTSYYKQYQFRDANGADRNIKAFAGATSKQEVTIGNVGSANTLQFQTNAGSNVGKAIQPGFSKTFIFDGTNWQELNDNNPEIYVDAAMAGNISLTSASKEILFLDANGSDRTVTAEVLPIPGRSYLVINTGSANTLQFQDNATNPIGEAIQPSEHGLFLCDDSGTWHTAMSQNFVGDSGSGGARGLVPAPAAGDAAANKFLKANGAWEAADHGDLIGLGDDDHTQYSLISSQGGAPSSTPSRVGEVNVDTTADTAYISTDTASSADWKLLQEAPSEGAFADGDKTKLDGIEALADVTDTTNVTAAGALMDSELTNITDVKALEIGTTAQAYDLVLDELASQTIIADATTTRTLALTDANDYIRFTSASDVTLTVPLNSSVAFPTGTRVDFIRIGAGNVTVAATGGVTINKAEGLKIAAQYKGATLIKVGTDEWDLIGALAA